MIEDDGEGFVRISNAPDPRDEEITRLRAENERLRDCRAITATVAMYDGTLPVENRFVDIPAIVARRAKAITAALQETGDEQ